LNVVSHARRALAAGLAACLLGAQSTSLADAAGLPFGKARERGTLVVGVPYLAPPAAAGAKVRTPERLDIVAAARLAEQLGLALEVVQIPPARQAQALAEGVVDVLLADRVQDQSAPALQGDGTAVVSAGYVTRSKAVIRSDTPLRAWNQVRGLTVCMS